MNAKPMIDWLRSVNWVRWGLTMIISVALGLLIGLADTVVYSWRLTEALVEKSIVNDKRFDRLEEAFLRNTMLVDDIVGVLERVVVAMDSTNVAHVPLEIYRLQSTIDSLRGNYDVDSLDARMMTIEQVVMENPEKATSLPLMRKEIEQMQKDLDKSEARIMVAVSDMDNRSRVYLGIMISTFLATAALAFNATRTKKSEPKPD